MEQDGSGGHGEPVIPDAFWRGLTSVLAFAAALLLMALVALVYTSNQQRDADHARERHSYEVMAVTYALGGAIESSEAALSRFIISGDRQVGTRYYHEWLRAGATLNRLRRLTADRPDGARLVARLRVLYDIHGKELAEPATLANYKKGWAALSLFYKAGQSPTGPEIRAILRKLADNERQTLDLRAAEAQASAERSNSMAALLSFLGIFLVLCAAMLGITTVQATAERHVARRNLRRETERAETLEVRVAERTEELETANRALLIEAEERAAAEAQLRQVQKMEAVGQLTGGIAHDFNNMLAVVVGGLDLAKRRVGSRDVEAGRHLDNAMEGATRAAALTRRLLAFARAEPLLPEGVNAGVLIGGMSDLLDRTIGERIRVETLLADGLWPVWVDPHQFENALLNLAVNARDAMSGEGVLRITTGNVRIAAGEIGQAEAGDYVRIEVRDEGVGMSREVLQRVFEPFFTTKPVGKGTGLGLSQVFGFVRQSDGEVTISSIEGSGTTVACYLPRFRGAVDRESAAIGEPQPAAADPGACEGVILVVEDDPRVRAATIAGLTELGHAPMPCGSGAEALEILARRTDVRLVVSDIVMPGMTGVELVRRMRQLHPEIGVLLVTGYVGDAGEAGDLSGYDILRKPFTIAALSGAVQTALARRLNAPPPASRAAEED
jgi:signal transduction histidine kinase/CheY-like chemotaxis protein